MIGFTTNRCLVVIHVLRMTCWYVQFRSSSRSTRDSTTHLELLSPWIYSMTGRKLEKTQEKRKNAASKLQTSSHYPIIIIIIIPSSSYSVQTTWVFGALLNYRKTTRTPCVRHAERETAPKYDLVSFDRPAV